MARWSLDEPAPAWQAAVARGLPVLVLDADVRADAVARVIAEAAGGLPAVAVHPVVDTVKSVADGVVTGTVSRDLLMRVAAPMLVPAAIAATVPAPTRSGLGPWVTALRERGEVRFVDVSPSAARSA